MVERPALSPIQYLVLKTGKKPGLLPFLNKAFRAIRAEGRKAKPRNGEAFRGDAHASAAQRVRGQKRRILHAAGPEVFSFFTKKTGPTF